MATTGKTQNEVQAGQITYALHSLGWKAFQSLCVTITAEVWGQTVTSFADTNDGGRDGAFQGVWSTKQGESFSGNFTIQAKFSAKESKSITLSELDDEFEKAESLAEKGLATTYILMTNTVLSGTNEKKIRAKFEAINGLVYFAAYGPTRISQMIHEHSRLRMLVPRVYGLGDLSQILDERAYRQSQDILSSLGDDLSKFVITQPYQASAHALTKHGFVLLLGEPACGKSTIAAALALGALDRWDCSTIKIVSPDEFITHSNPDEKKQFFWVDDAFGVTQLDWSATVGWNKVFPHVQAAIKKGARVVFTSRDYLYRSAREHLKSTAFPLLVESQVVIKVEDLTRDEREQILYNHIRLGSQAQSFKAKLKPYLTAAADHKRFSPESARRLGSPFFTKELNVSKFDIDDFFDRPMGLLVEVVRTLDADSKSALAIVFVRNGRLPSPVDITPVEKKAIAQIGGSVANVRRSLVSLGGSMLSLVTDEGVVYWGFKHPTIRDAFATLISEDPELLDVYIAGTLISRLLAEVSCGDVKLEGVKVMIPDSRFDLFSERIEKYMSLKRENRSGVYWFLAYRCNDAFLKRFLKRNTGFVENLQVDSYLYAVADVAVLVHLHQLGLLPESKRKAVVAEIENLAIEVPDSGFLADDVKSLFHPDEFAHLSERVKGEVVRNIDAYIDNFRANYPRGDDPESFFEPLTSTLNEYENGFRDDADAMEKVSEALASVRSAIRQLEEEMPPEPDYEEHYSRGKEEPADSSERSIFDDVDS